MVPCQETNILIPPDNTVYPSHDKQSHNLGADIGLWLLRLQIAPEKVVRTSDVIQIEYPSTGESPVGRGMLFDI